METGTVSLLFGTRKALPNGNMNTLTEGLSGGSPSTDLPKLVASDIGGTLVMGVGIIPSFTAAILNRLMEMDIPVALLTGYNYATVKGFTGNLDPKVLLMPQNGSLCIRDNEIVWEYRILEPEAEALYRYFHENDLPIIIYKGKNEDFKNYYVSREEQPLSYGFQRIDRLVNFEDITGISTLIPNPVVSEVKENIESIVGEKFKVIYSRGPNRSWLEVVHTAVRKDLALKRLCDEMRIPTGNVIYFGDNFNDLEVLRLVGHPVVVENAASELKKEFFDIAGAVTREGVAHYLKLLYSLSF
jgi:HAD superfamily hydrolase (TIGR01484 family)